VTMKYLVDQLMHAKMNCTSKNPISSQVVSSSGLLPLTTGLTASADNNPPVAVAAEGISIAGCRLVATRFLSCGSRYLLTRAGTVSILGTSLTYSTFG
jgi:hypothetical protein